MEAKSETNKQISSFLFILWAGGAALLSYSLVYALRKPFTAATFDGMDFFGMDYKVATTIMQIFGYLISKFFAIKIVSELKRSGMAKSMGLFVVNTFGVTEFWMPALIGGLAFPLLILMGWSLNKLPQPTDEDRALRSERVTLNGEQRRQLFKSYMPLLIMLFPLSWLTPSVKR